jgi:hypothetical protein
MSFRSNSHIALYPFVGVLPGIESLLIESSATSVQQSSMIQSEGIVSNVIQIDGIK